MKLLSEKEWAGTTKKAEIQDSRIQELEKGLEDARVAILNLVKEKLLQQFPEYSELLSNDTVVEKIWENKLDLGLLSEDMLERKPIMDTVIDYSLDGDWEGGHGTSEYFEIHYLDDSQKPQTYRVRPDEYEELRRGTTGSGYETNVERRLTKKGEKIGDSLSKINKPSLVIWKKNEREIYGWHPGYSDPKLTVKGFLHPGLKDEKAEM